MKEIIFNWNIKEKPEYFIVKEIANFEKGSNFYLYLLAKKGYNTWELSKKLGFSYAGLKDKNALTFQFVSFNEDKGKIIRNFEEDKFFVLKKVGKIKRKIKPGFLEGNKFFIYHGNCNYKIKKKNKMLNYYDLQRIKGNWEKGLNLIKKLINNKEKAKKIKPKNLNWLERFWIDSFLSFIWNESLKEFILNNFDKEDLIFVKEKEFSFLFLKRLEDDKLPYNWPILGYKIKEKDLNDTIFNCLDNFNLNWKELKELLKDLRLKGDFRKVVIDVKGFKKTEKYLSFFLPKGGYATMYLKQIIF
jgi:tRNA pseudouridine13 synthase